MKVCCTCKVEKSFEEFYSASNTSDGYQRQCKMCKKFSNKPEHNKQRCKRYRQTNPEKAKETSKAWRANNLKYSINYYHNRVDKQELFEKGARYIRERYSADPVYRLKKKLSSQVYSYLSGRNKSKRTMQLIGYSLEDFVSRHSSGALGQDLDHKIPVTWFTEEAPLSLIWHLDNLQWMEAKENKAKGNRHMHPVSESYLQQVLPYIKEEFAGFVKK